SYMNKEFYIVSLKDSVNSSVLEHGRVYLCSHNKDSEDWYVKGEHYSKKEMDYYFNVRPATKEESKYYILDALIQTNILKYLDLKIEGSETGVDLVSDIDFIENQITFSLANELKSAGIFSKYKKILNYLLRYAKKNQKELYQRVFDNLKNYLEKERKEALSAMVSSRFKLKESRDKQPWEMTFDEFKNYIKVRKLKEPVVKFKDFLKEKGYAEADIPSDRDLADLIGGMFSAKTRAAKGKLKGVIKKQELYQNLINQYKEAVNAGVIGQKERDILLDLSKSSDLAYARVQHKRAIRGALAKGMKVPEAVLQQYPELIKSNVVIEKRCQKPKIEKLKKLMEEATSNQPENKKTVEKEFYEKVLSTPDEGKFKPKKEIKDVDYGSRIRGQGKRIGGMVKGGMYGSTSTPKYGIHKEEEIDYLHEIPEVETNPEDFKFFNPLRNRIYLKARNYGMNHKQAYNFVWHVVDPDRGNSIKFENEKIKHFLGMYPELNTR
ncbi:MAG: hypothetical protein QXG00_07965, partial [Candidatus Woesearchaeota archaeon]